MLAENFSERCKEKKKRRKFDGRWEEKKRWLGAGGKEAPSRGSKTYSLITGFGNQSQGRHDPPELMPCMPQVSIDGRPARDESSNSAAGEAWVKVSEELAAESIRDEIS